MGLRWVWPLLLVIATIMLTAPPVYSDGVTFAVPASHTNQSIIFSGQVTQSNLDFVYATQNDSYASTPLNCQPGVQNQYPQNANAGQKIVIITTVTSECASDPYLSQIIVNILPPNSSEILSTAPASPAINTVTAPATGGPWSLIVQVFWNDNPTGGNIAMYQTTITIKINGPLTISTVTPSPTHPHFPSHARLFSFEQFT